MKRYQTEVQKKTGKWSPSKDPMLAAHPTLNQLCTDAFWDDGKPREVCTLKWRFGVDQVQLTISDEDARASITTWAQTSAEALELLEDALTNGKASWRPWPGQGKGKRG